MRVCISALRLPVVSLQNAKLLCYCVRYSMVLVKAIPAVRNRLCFLGHLKLIEENLPPLASLLLLLVFTPVLLLLFFQV